MLWLLVALGPACSGQLPTSAAMILIGQARSDPSGSTGGPLAPARYAEDLRFADGLYRDRRFDLAAEEYARLVERAPRETDTSEAELGLANSLLFLGKYAQSRSVFERFLARHPTHPSAPSALFRVGEAAYLLGEVQNASESLTKFVAANPSHPQAEIAWSHLGDLGLRTKSFDRAVASYERSLKTAKGPVAARARFGLGRAKAALGRFDDAISEFQILQRDGGPEWSERALLEVGRCAIDAGKWAQAESSLAAFEKAHTRSSLLDEARLLRLSALRRLARDSEAEELSQSLLASRNPSVVAQAASLRAELLAGRGDLAGASESLAAVARKAPETSAPALLLQAAEFAERAKQDERAIELYLEFVERFPNDPSAESTTIRAAARAAATGRSARSLEIIGRLRDRRPRLELASTASVIEARALLDLGRAKESASILEKLQSTAFAGLSEPDSAAYLLASAYRADGRTNQARSIWERLARDPKSSRRADASYSLARALLDSKSPAESIPWFDSYVELRPDGDVAEFAQVGAIEAAIASDRLDDARRRLETLQRRFPAGKALPDLGLRLAEAEARGGRHDRSIETFGFLASSKDPETKARATYGLAWSLLSSGNAADARDAFRRLLTQLQESDPRIPNVQIGLARALSKAGGEAEALAEYDRVIKSERGATVKGIALVEKGRLLASAGRPAEAAEALGEAVGKHASSCSVPLDELLAELGWALADAKKGDESDTVFRRLLEEFPKSARAADARFHLAESHFEQGRFEEAVTMLKPITSEAVRVPGSMLEAAQFRRARCRLEQRRWSEAESTFQGLLDRFPEGALTHRARFWHAETAFRAGRIREALERIEKLLGKSSGALTEDLQQLAEERRLDAWVELERWDDVLKASEGAVAPTGRPNSARMRLARGRAMMGLARFDDARRELEAVVESDKGKREAAAAQFLIGESHFHQKDYRSAEREYLKVDYLHDAPKWQSSALLQVGKLYERLSRWAEAAETYQRLIDKFPTTAAAEDAKERLTAVTKRRQDSTQRK
ncbi:MAG: tetratricopeptide repeat protein [Isosphaeraceae bacterium]|nr:tetratricopeptide repeat protein [Isosphaeraceae bacterium]